MLTFIKTQLIDTGTFMGKACDFCCDVVQWCADAVGMTYEELNMYAFYILQPVIYILFALWGSWLLYRLSARGGFLPGKISSAVMALANIVMAVIVFRTFYGADMNALFYVKVDAIAASATEWGISYSAWNLLVFAVFFILVCVFHTETVRLYRRGWLIPLFVWSWLMMLLSPLLVFVFFV